MISPIYEIMHFWGEAYRPKKAYVKPKARISRAEFKKTFDTLSTRTDLTLEEFITFGRMRGGAEHIAKVLGMRTGTIHNMRESGHVSLYWTRYLELKHATSC